MARQYDEDNMTLNEVFNPSDPATLEEYGSLRQTQEQVLAQHQAYSQGLERVSDATLERQQDLDLTGRFFQLLNPATPKAAKGFLFNETARTMGLDPKAAGTSEIGKLLTSLDPQSAEAVRAMLSDEMQRAGPGAMQRMYKGILQGSVPISDLLQRTQQHATARAQQEGQAIQQDFPERPAGMMRLGGPVQEDGDSVPNTASNNTPEMASRLPPLQRPAPPGLVQRYGLDPNRPWTMQDIVGLGYTGPTDEAGVNKFLRGDQSNPGIDDRDNSFRQLSANIAQMEDIIREGGAGVLRWGTVRLPMMGEYKVPTMPEVAAKVDDILGPNAPAYRDTPQPREGQAREGDTTFRQRYWARQAAKGILGEVDIEGDPAGPPLTPRQMDAERRRLTGQLESIMSDSIFLLGTISGQGGRSLSDQDRDFMMQQFGSSTDPSTRIRVLRDTMSRAYERISAERGGVPLNIGAISPEQRQLLLNSTIIPEGLRNQIQAYNNQEAQGRAPQASPTQQAAPQATQQPAAPAAQQPAAPRQEPAAAPTREPAAAEPRREGNLTPPAGLNRAEREQWIARQRAQEDRQFRLAQMQAFLNNELRAQDANTRAANAEGRAEEAHNRGTPFQRQEIARRQLERAQDKFQAAMAKIAAMVAGSAPKMSTGGGGGGGGGQDSSAFRLPPRPQRQAPSIPRVRKSD